MKVFVTGAHGMLGSDLAGLLRHTSDVFECARHNCDILQYAQLEEMIASYRPDVIIHTAAYTNVDQAESDKDAAMLLNETGTQHVAEIAQAYQAKLVHVSTDYVFDGTKTTPYQEDNQPHPAGVYGETKLRAEQQVQHIFNHADRRQAFLIVRTAWLYGRHGKNFVSAILQRARQHNTLQVVNDQTGAPTYTKDLARGIMALLTHNASGIVHVTNTGSCTWYDFAKTILEFAGISEVTVEPITAQQLGRPAPRPAFSVLDTSRFTMLTGQKMRHWKEGLQEYFEEINA